MIKCDERASTVLLFSLGAIVNGGVLRAHWRPNWGSPKVTKNEISNAPAYIRAAALDRSHPHTRNHMFMMMDN